ncbi:MAG: glycosyltransferase family 2 protein [Chloroflexota bacterium]
MPTVEQVLSDDSKPIEGLLRSNVVNVSEFEPSRSNGFTQSGVSVIIPAFNEESAVGSQVQAVRAALSEAKLQHEIIVVDDASQDRTAAAVRESGARLIRHAENRGYGASIKTGIQAAEYEIIVICDADGTYPADQIPLLVAQLECADMVVGARIGTEVHIPLIRRPAKWILGKFASYIAGRKIPDLNSGLRVFRRECITQYFPILSNRFSFTTTSTLAFLADDYRVVYHPINYYRRTGTSKITPGHFMEFIMLVLKMSMMFQPLRIFMPWAMTCAALGFGKTIFDISTLIPRYGRVDESLLYQPVLSSSATLLLLTALQLLLIGMVAEGLLRRVAQNRPIVRSHAVISSDESPSVQLHS